MNNYTKKEYNKQIFNKVRGSCREKKERVNLTIYPLTSIK